MPNTKLQSIAMSILAAGMFVAAQGCSSSSSGGNLMAACMQGCAKEVPCLADAGFPETVSACVQSCLASGQPDGGTCTNESAIVSAAQACAAKTTCADLESCALGIPQWQHGGAGTGGTSGSGTGGTSGAGTGGTSGTGGMTGGGGAGGAGATANCSICDKAATCCTAAGEPATTCSGIPTSTACNAATGSTQSGDIQACQGVIAAGKLLAPTATACQ